MKYRQPGYHDNDYKEERQKREKSGPRGPREITTREATAVVRCFNCGHQTSPSQEIALDSVCEKCGEDVHICRNCIHFDSSARWECRKEYPGPRAIQDRPEPVRAVHAPDRPGRHRPPQPRVPPRRPTPGPPSTRSSRRSDAGGGWRPRFSHHPVDRPSSAARSGRRRSARRAPSRRWSPPTGSRSTSTCACAAGARREDAEDLTQGFFTRAMEKEFFGGYDPAKARFRTFLRTCLDRFVANEDQAPLGRSAAATSISRSISSRRRRSWRAAPRARRLARGGVSRRVDAQPVRPGDRSARRECDARRKSDHFSPLRALRSGRSRRGRRHLRRSAASSVCRRRR